MSLVITLLNQDGGTLLLSQRFEIVLQDQIFYVRSVSAGSKVLDIQQGYAR
jgi:hypothetical protein